MTQRCDCTSYCGDDPGLKDGSCRPCEGQRRWMVERSIPDATKVHRGPGRQAVTVSFSTPLSEEQLAAFARKLGAPE